MDAVYWYKITFPEVAMFVRVARPDESRKVGLIQIVAFEMSYDPEEKTDSHPDPMTHWVAGEGDELFASIGVLPTEVRFDGHVVPMVGIGGVSTLPQHRRKGAIRACLTEALNDARRSGSVFSVLYPFSRAYYRQFGYEDGASASFWTLPFSAIQPQDVGGSIQMIMPGEDFTPVYQVYETCSANWNLSMPESFYLKNFSKQNWMKDRRYIYIWRDENGTPAGLILFSKVDGVMDCLTQFGRDNCLLFRDARALTALLRFAKGFAADYSAIRFAAPQGVRIQSLIGEGNAVQGELRYNCMARLLNVPRALELCKTTGEGSLVISVEDKLLPENNAAWKVTFRPDGENIVEATDSQPDLSMPVGELTQLLLGVCSAQDIPMMPRIVVHTPSAPFNQIFLPKPCHIIDLF